ncbi:hypothetical protein FB446DRAFT_731240 [Lentinula raphanica]|nr:hypothetical protein FB446DRAFT_731240 [Lentinula raphanica]
MHPGSSSRQTHMSFDDFNKSQSFSFSSSPASRTDKVVWQMPPPSNPALQRLMDNADNDVRRTNPAPHHATWDSASTHVSPGPIASNSRLSTRAADKRSTTSFGINPEIAQLVDPVLLRSVAEIASQKAQERSKALGLVMKRKHGSLRSAKSEKSITTGKPRARRAVSSGMVEKSGSDLKKRDKGKGRRKETSLPAGFSFSNHDVHGQPTFDDSPSTTISATSSSTNVLEVSMSTADTSMDNSSEILSHREFSPPSPRRSPNHLDDSTIKHEDKPVIIRRPHPANNDSHLSRTRRDQQNFDASIETAHTSSKVAVKAVAPPSMSHPRPSANPPALGMRRFTSLPAKNNASSTKPFGVVNDLPTKRRPFKTPFLPTTQRPSDHGQIAPPTFAPSPQRIQEPKSEPDGMNCDDAETSFEYDSFDMDVLEDVLKQYD